MDATKIRLSAKETELVLNADWILTKNEILKKVKLLLEAVLTEQQNITRSQKPLLPAEIWGPHPKISKGENYKGLPYLVLDHPRHFDKENVFVIRTMFWWGNFFSMTLHLSGQYKKKYEQQVAAAYPLLKDVKMYYCINEDQWEHHFEKDNYAPLTALDKDGFKRAIQERPFIKIAKNYSLGEWDNMISRLPGDFKFLLTLLENS